MRTIKKFLILFFIWRFLIFVPLYFGQILLPYRPSFGYTNLWYYIKPYFPVNNIFLYPWANFDGVHYLSIAGQGYTNNGRFFPFYPFLIWIFSRIFGGGNTYGSTQFFTAFLLANFCFFLCLIFLYKLIRLDFSQKIASLSLVFLLLFPTSFYFGSIYAESLFLLLLVLSLYFARKKQWFMAGIFGLLLSVTRPVGITIFPVILYEFLHQEKKLSVKIVPLFISLLGILGYAWFNLKKWGDALYFLKAQGELANSRSINKIILLPQTIFRYFKILKTIPIYQYEWSIALLELTVFVFVVILLFFGWQKKIRLSYILFTLFCFLMPTLSGTFSGLPRYSAVLFPIFISLTLVKSKTVKIIYIFISLVLLFFLTLFFSRGYYVS